MEGFTKVNKYTHILTSLVNERYGGEEKAKEIFSNLSVTSPLGRTNEIVSEKVNTLLPETK